jgi:hypothetical protein
MSGSDAKVRDERVVILIEENVVGLDVAMNQSPAVGVIEAGRYLRRDRRGGLGRK